MAIEARGCGDSKLFNSPLHEINHGKAFPQPQPNWNNETYRLEQRAPRSNTRSADCEETERSGECCKNAENQTWNTRIFLGERAFVSRMGTRERGRTKTKNRHYLGLYHRILRWRRINSRPSSIGFARRKLSQHKDYDGQYEFGILGENTRIHRHWKNIQTESERPHIEKSVLCFNNQWQKDTSHPARIGKEIHSEKGGIEFSNRVHSPNDRKLSAGEITLQGAHHLAQGQDELYFGSNSGTLWCEETSRCSSSEIGRVCKWQ